LSEKEMMRLRYERQNSTNEIKFLREQVGQESGSDDDLEEDIKEIKEFNEELQENLPTESEIAPLVLASTNSSVELFEAPNAYVDECNLGCHKNCLHIKKRVPFEVLEMCTRDKCHCDHSLALSNKPPKCGETCRNNCLA
jgi:hypothetical protein